MSNLIEQIIEMIDQYGIVNGEMANDELMLMTVPRRGQLADRAEETYNHTKRASKHAHREQAAIEIAALVRDLVAKVGA